MMNHLKGIFHPNRNSDDLPGEVTFVIRRSITQSVLTVINQYIIIAFIITSLQKQSGTCLYSCALKLAVTLCVIQIYSHHFKEPK